MNIFHLDDDPAVCARMMHDKHVVKMVLESTQILCTAQREYGNTKVPYRSTHVNHPCVQWVCQNVMHYDWLLAHLEALLKEYTHRYGRIHTCAAHLRALESPPKGMPVGCYLPPPQCVPEPFKQADVCKAYQEYYLAHKVQQSRWTGRAVPAFITDEGIKMAQAKGKTAPAEKPAPAAKSAPAAEVKEEKATQSRGPKGVEGSAKVTLLAVANPKRPGSKAHARFEFYQDEQTVDEALAAGITTPDLIYDAAHEFIQIEGYTPPKIIKPKEKAPKPEKELAEKPEPKGKPVAKKKAKEPEADGDELE